MPSVEEITFKLSQLKRTETTVRTATGEAYVEVGSCQNSLPISSPYIMDKTRDVRADRVLPWLYMGAVDVAYDVDQLRALNVFHVLSIGVPAACAPINSTFIKAYDEPGFDITSVFELCFLTIERARYDFGVVYVHCNAGVSRSATVVIGYLMKYHGLRLLQAYDLVKRRRPKIKPNAGFMQQLRQFEQRLGDVRPKIWGCKRSRHL